MRKCARGLPDAANSSIRIMLKFILDCLNGLAWQDDTQITSLQVTKMYSEYDETKIFIQEENAQLQVLLKPMSKSSARSTDQL